MTCKGLCKKIKVTYTIGRSMYAQGYKWCALCEVFVDWLGRFCPCCSLKLRTKARAAKCWKPDKRPWEITA